MERRKSGLGIWLSLLCAVLIVLLAACGGDDSSAEGDSAVPVVPTMPSARFTAVGQQNPTSAVAETATLTASMALSETELVTNTTITTTATQADPAAAEPEVDEAFLARGAGIYERNNCADCHGAAGEGVAGQAGVIASTALSEAEFSDVLRTGGGLGNTHIFGASAVSPSGMGALYAYVQSLDD